eukprot:365233-Prymnesium_polylepis.1
MRSAATTAFSPRSPAASASPRLSHVPMARSHGAASDHHPASLASPRDALTCWVPRVEGRAPTLTRSASASAAGVHGGGRRPGREPSRRTPRQSEGVEVASAGARKRDSAERPSAAPFSPNSVVGVSWSRDAPRTR